MIAWLAAGSVAVLGCGTAGFILLSDNEPSPAWESNPQAVALPVDEINNPAELAADPDGTVYVLSKHSTGGDPPDTIFRLEPNASQPAEFFSTSIQQGRLASSLDGIAVGHDGDFYVVQSDIEIPASPKLLRIDPSSGSITASVDIGAHSPYRSATAVAPDGTVYVSTRYADSEVPITSWHCVIYSVDPEFASAHEVFIVDNCPDTPIAVDPAGAFHGLILDEEAVTTNGVAVAEFDIDRQVASELPVQPCARVSRIAYGGNGTLYASCSGSGDNAAENYSVAALDPSGILEEPILAAGQGVLGIAVVQHSLYVSDTAGNVSEIPFSAQ